jgi:hypothetical protein
MKDKLRLTVRKGLLIPYVLHNYYKCTFGGSVMEFTVSSLRAKSNQARFHGIA